MLKIFKYKAFTLSLVVGLCFSLIFSAARFEDKCNSIRENVVRLHILANSDSNEDQQLKYRIRDAVISYSSEIFDGTLNKSQAMIKAAQNIPFLKGIAEQTVKQSGYNYKIDVKLDKTYFNTRTYTNATFPAGFYDSLIITVGEGKGKNWWCVMFPPLCISAAGENVSVDDVLDEEQTEIVQNPKRYKCRFWIVEKYYELKNFVFSIF